MCFFTVSPWEGELNRYSLQAKTTPRVHPCVVLTVLTAGFSPLKHNICFNPVLTHSPGLLPPKELLATSKTVDLIYEGVKYSLVCCQAGPRFFTVTTLKGDEGKVGGGNALVEAQCRPLADGGYLLVIAGKSQVSEGGGRQGQREGGREREGWSGTETLDRQADRQTE